MHNLFANLSDVYYDFLIVSQRCKSSLNTFVCYNNSMELYRTADVLRALQEGLEPVERAGTMIDLVEGQRPDARKSAVLLPLFELNGEITLVFIRRALTLRNHSGEIAFPGGRTDPTDLSPVMTALREAREEIGLEPDRVQILGVLPPIFTVVSNYLITPVVAFLPHGLGPIHLQDSEVAELILAPLRALADPAIAHIEYWPRGGVTRKVYFYDYGPYRIWGATGRMLNSLLALLSTGGVRIDEITH
jgi:8-oxo-dGTP pyrophosphatase MutT (NUDIX family)